MVNVGLRAYLWNQKDRSQRTTRELWTLNDSTYSTYRQYTSYVKEHGFPEQSVDEHVKAAIPRGGQPTLQKLTSLATQSSLARNTSRSFTFAGMKQIFDQGTARTTCLRFGHNSSELLAWGSADGSVRIATLQEPSRIMHELRLHKRMVADLDWSPDNLLLASVAEDGGMCLWQVDSGQPMRTFMLGSPVTSCRFLRANANFVVAGTLAGELHILNCSTALTQEKVQMSARGPHRDGGGVCAMETAGDLLFIASTTGCLLTFRCTIRNGMLQPLQALFRTLPPPRKARHVEAANIAFSPFACIAHGPALLVPLASCHLCVLKVIAATGALELLVKTQMPPAARKLKATFCPSDDVTEPEYIAMGGENTGVYVYDISQPELNPVVISELQGHMAPVVDVSWSADETLLASCDCDGVVIVWRRHKQAKLL